MKRVLASLAKGKLKALANRLKRPLLVLAFFSCLGVLFGLIQAQDLSLAMEFGFLVFIVGLLVALLEGFPLNQNKSPKTSWEIKGTN